MEHEVASSLHRAALYKLAAGAFAYPGPDRRVALARLAGCCHDARPAADPLRPALGRLRLALEAEPGALEEEYTRLFDRQVRCPPYETAYGGAGRLAGKPAELADVAGFYTAFGLAPSATTPDMEDHVAAELEFMSLLAVKEAAALATGRGEALEVTRRAMRAFLRDHLGRWVGAFAGRLRDNTAEPFYRAAADLVTRLVAEEARTLGVLPKAVDGLTGPDPMQADELACPFAERCETGGAGAGLAPPRAGGSDPRGTNREGA